jgi:hypothetical protein
MTIDLRETRRAAQDRMDIEKPERGVVRSVLPGIEVVKVEVAGSTGTSTIVVRHPFMGINSWIRCMPETGTNVIAQKISDPAQREIWGYISHRLGSLVKQAKEDNSFIYREMRPGEIEIMSSGRAYTHWSEEGDISSHGGVVEQYLLQTELEVVQRAPTHRRQLDQHEPINLEFEERFGLVKRPDTAKPYSRQRYIKDSSDAYQYEYGRWITGDDGKPIVNTHEGHLYDIDGNEVKNGRTSKRVRYRKVINEVANRGDLTIDVDEDLSIILANTAPTKITDLDFGAMNEIKLRSKKLDFVVSQSSSQTFTQALTVTSGKIRMNSSDVGLGPAPTFAALLGPPVMANVINPMISMMTSVASTLAAEPALSADSKAILVGLTSGLMVLAITAAGSGMLSTTVKLSG